MDEDDREDLNRQGIDDEIEGAMYDVAAGRKHLADRFPNNLGTCPTLSGGDVDARWDDVAYPSVTACLSARSTPATPPRE